MNTLEATNQGLTLLLRSHSHCDSDLLSDGNQFLTLYRAKTIITLGYSMLQKLEVEALSGQPG
jgi:hypothetical protein